MNGKAPSRIILEIARSEPGRPTRFEVPVPAPTSRVLDALLYVREHLDPSLGFRYSCRAGMCGSCAVVVNGREALACQLSIGELPDGVVRIEPLRALPVLRDLTPDLEPFFDTLRRAQAALRPTDPARATPRTLPPGAPHRAAIEAQNGCLTCGACFSACASASPKPMDLGPAALNRVFMLVLDERDALGKSRLAAVAGEARSHDYGDCGSVCPVDIPLGEGLRRLRELAAAQSR